LDNKENFADNLVLFNDQMFSCVTISTVAIGDKQFTDSAFASLMSAAVLKRPQCRYPPRPQLFRIAERIAFAPLASARR